MVRNILLAVLAAFICVSTTVADGINGSSSDIILQGFHWESNKTTTKWWDIVADKADDIGKSGFTMVWLPPSSFSASNEGYLPNRLYFQSSKYGSEKQLKNAIGQLHKNGVKAIADIVINHRVGTKNWADFTEPQWSSDAVCANDEWPDAAGSHDTGEGFHAGRDIDHTKTYVRESIIKWMNWLKSDIGYDGWRYDYSKGYAGHFVAEYNSATQPYFSVGELWDNLNLNDTDPHRQQLANWLDSAKGLTAAFDFTTKGILQHAVAHNQFWRLRDSNGKPSGLIGWWAAKSVTFIDNHDTGPSVGGGQNHWPFPSNKVMWGYAYILTHPGTPTVYWVHYYDWGLKDQIQKLIQIRRAQRITSTSGVEIKAADNSKYAAIIDGKVAVKFGPGDWSPGNGWKVATSGQGYAVWTKP